jgi:hypothetical protein
MCTTGAIVLSKDEYILFKNKDFGKKQFQDHLVVEEGLFGASGTETFAEQDVAKEVFSGLSIGANSHGLFGCDSHVSYEPAKAANYDKLVEVALRDAVDVDSAVTVLKEHVGANPTWAGNLVLTDGLKTARIEARGAELEVQVDLHSIVSTNHQFLFSSDNAEASASSTERLNSAHERLSKASSIDEVFALLASHDRGDTGVCNHQAELKTVYSYVLHSKNGIATLYVSNQQPCETDKYQALKLPIGDNWNQTNVAQFQEAYPN